MKRVMIFVLVLAMIVAVGGVVAAASGQRNVETLKQKLNDLDYEVYTMESQYYEGETMAPDAGTILYYSPEGYALASIYDSYFERSDTFILQFASASPLEALIGVGSYSVDGQTIAITDEDGWTAVFTPAGRSAERSEIDVLLQSLACENGMDSTDVHMLFPVKAK
ncbi:MAG: hypothetical protein ILP09_00395 [Oscillospiraceae bacterium]|nr:hypothetical protein [Oscillospiraceae bacterium]